MGKKIGVISLDVFLQLRTGTAFALHSHGTAMLTSACDEGMDNHRVAEMAVRVEENM